MVNRCALHGGVETEPRAGDRCRECQLAVSAISGSGPGLVLSFRSRGTSIPPQVSGAVAMGLVGFALSRSRGTLGKNLREGHEKRSMANVRLRIRDSEAELVE